MRLPDPAWAKHDGKVMRKAMDVLQRVATEPGQGRLVLKAAEIAADIRTPWMKSAMTHEVLRVRVGLPPRDGIDILYERQTPAEFIAVHLASSISEYNAVKKEIEGALPSGISDFRTASEWLLRNPKTKHLVPQSLADALQMIRKPQ